ncbi:hypothetical protein CHS0354_000558 [Potamilus streckersoni]|uniref:Methylamine utilisation protein MauE domain-containing protein n=1 Tax=Potamilus streckersoni TaxID=2493646 RepID=A0AAE0T6R9_9BIVA|nr:hypothetical protein CHS0354_000558 [Potamilus streckersoni]
MAIALNIHFPQKISDAEKHKRSNETSLADDKRNEKSCIPVQNDVSFLHYIYSREYKNGQGNRNHNEKKDSRDGRLVAPFYLKKIVLPVGMFMVVMFTGYMAILAFEGETGNCGCFGDIVVMSPIQTIIKNIALLLGMVYLYFNVEERNEHVLDVAVIMVASLIVPGFVSPVLKSEGPPQGAVQQEGKAVIALKQFPIEKYNKVIVDSMGRKIDISVGTKLVAVFNMDCGYCRVEATGIGKLMKEAKKFPEMYCLYYGTTAVTEFEKNTQVKVPNKKITRDEYISLILENKSSTVYWLENGIAKAHWGDHMAQKLKEAFNL